MKEMPALQANIFGSKKTLAKDAFIGSFKSSYNSRYLSESLRGSFINIISLFCSWRTLSRTANTVN
jgi:hypothetical protein